MSDMRPLGEVAEIVRGISFPKEARSTELRSGDIACLRTTNVQQRVEWEDLWFVPIKYVRRDEQYVRQGDILISTANSRELVGKVALVSLPPRPSTLGAFISLIRPRDGVNPKFLYHQLAWGRTQSRIRETASTTTNISNVSTKKLLALDLRIPGLEEQDRIVSEIEKQFSRLDGTVTNLKRIKANLKRYKGAVLNAAVRGDLVPTEAELARREGRSYESGEELLARTLVKRRAGLGGKGKHVEQALPDTSALPKLPEGWSWSTVDQISIVVRGASPRPAGDPRYFGGLIPWITVGPITSDEDAYLRAVPETVTEAGKERSRYIEPHTLLLTNSGATLGVPKITKIGGCINDGVAALLEIDYPTKLYLLYFLRTLTEKLRSINQGAAQPNLNTSIIKALAVPLPPLAEQDRIVAEVDRRLSLVREIEAEIEANQRRAERLRQVVLRVAFGEGLAGRNAFAADLVHAESIDVSA